MNTENELRGIFADELNQAIEAIGREAVLLNYTHSDGEVMYPPEGLSRAPKWPTLNRRAEDLGFRYSVVTMVENGPLLELHHPITGDVAASVWCYHEDDLTSKAVQVCECLEAWVNTVVPAPTDDASENDNDPQGDTDQLSPRNKALAVVREHPDWTYKQIAKAVGVHPQTPKNWPEIKALKKSNCQYPPPPRGSKSAEGNIDASDDAW